MRFFNDMARRLRIPPGTEGVLAKLAFWRSKKDQSSPQLQIVVSEAGEKSRVSVSGAEGKPADATTQTRILNLLHKELK
jgi:outer membrane protein assembly factor BamC